MTFELATLSASRLYLTSPLRLDSPNPSMLVLREELEHRLRAVLHPARVQDHHTGKLRVRHVDR